MTGSGKITFYGTTWCGASRRSRRIMDQHEIPYQWIDVDQDEQAAELVRGLNQGNCTVPTLVWPDGSHLVEPSDQELMLKLGLA